ncbi:9188_t:CDS:2 [Cetraspora pellucida]|uniref:9188_t:CDS:1 n=1 Tax=Cetraspora pellucida TaxID=1433469 RepID=A0A9N9I004_9GLOM|nr:9188_t:CDS:2 [Cetraspora pellucida]
MAEIMAESASVKITFEATVLQASFDGNYQQLQKDLVAYFIHWFL